MACCQYRTNPLPKQMVSYCQLDPQKKLQKFGSKYNDFHSKNMHLKISSAKCQPLDLGFNLIASTWTLWTPYGIGDLVNAGSGNGLLLESTKPLPEPKVSYQFGPVTTT